MKAIPPARRCPLLVSLSILTSQPEQPQRCPITRLGLPVGSTALCRRRYSRHGYLQGTGEILLEQVVLTPNFASIPGLMDPGTAGSFRGRKQGMLGRMEDPESSPLVQMVGGLQLLGYARPERCKSASLQGKGSGNVYNSLRAHQMPGTSLTCMAPVILTVPQGRTY